MYGLLRGCLDIWHQARAACRNWLYIDNGYFKTGHFDGHYSVTWNRFQHDGRGDYPRGYERAKALGLTIEPWSKGGKHILIMPPTDIFANLMGFTPGDWVSDTTEKLKNHTDRPIKVRYKPKPGSKGPTLREDVEGCHAVVTYNSKAACEALLWGYPAFVTTKNAATALAKRDITEIEDPLREGNREMWLAALAANQWTLAEMKSGRCFRDLEDDLSTKRTVPPPANETVPFYFP